MDWLERPSPTSEDGVFLRADFEPPDDLQERIKEDYKGTARELLAKGMCAENGDPLPIPRTLAREQCRRILRVFLDGMLSRGKDGADREANSPSASSSSA